MAIDINLNTRVKTAVLLAAPVAFLFILGLTSDFGVLLLSIVAALVICLCAWEFSSTCAQAAGRLHQLSYFAGCLLCPLLTYVGYFFLELNTLNPLALIFVAIYISYLFFAFFAFLVNRNDAFHGRATVTDLSIGIFLVGFCGAALILLPHQSKGVLTLLWLLAVVIANDVGAYFGGLHFRGIKLSPHVSPNKTISGALSGLLAGMIIGFLLATALLGFTSFEALVFSIVIGLSAQLGDLAKSYVKRLHQVKDMGNILPGHGGVLDRVDGLLAATPWALVLTTFIK